MASSAPILPLSPDAISQIKSSIAIISLNGVIFELLKNALDAQAHKVKITVEYGRGSCSVEDDGLGIPPAEFQDNGGLGKLYHTSKHDCTAPTHGSRGSFLASLAALSLVSITSHHHKYHSQNTLSINRSQVIARQCPTPPQQHITVFTRGTRVTVRDLFGNMPVRVKLRAIELEKRPGSRREWEDLRKGVIRLVLAWPFDVGVLIKDGSTGQKVHFQPPRQANGNAMPRPESNLITHLCNTLSQGLLISSPEQTNWVPMNGATGEIHILGAISLDPAPTKAVQFVSLGISPVGTEGGNNILYEEINRLFENSSFGSVEDQQDLDEQERMRRPEDRRYKTNGITHRGLQGSKKGTDRWPMFFFKIDFADAANRNVATTHDDSLAIKGSLLTSIVDLLRAMILEFLKCHHFQIKSACISTFARVYPSGDTEDSSHLKPEADTEEDIDCDKKAVRSHSNHSGSHSLGHMTMEGSHGMNNTRGRMDSSLATPRNRTESPFNIWPRVKSGRPKVVSKIPEQYGDPESSVLGATKGRQESSMSRSTAQPSLVSTSPPSFRIPCLNHALGKSGKVIQAPFRNLPTIPSKNPPLSHIRNDNVQISKAVNHDGDDGMLTWINSITNERSFVNARTGLVIPSAEDAAPSCNVYSKKPRSFSRPSVQDNINLNEASRSSHERSAWIENIVRNWKNPIFSPTELGIPQVSLGCADAESKQRLYRDGRNYSQFEIDKVIQASSVGLAGRISKTALRQAQVISQVDKKFVLVKMPSDVTEPAAKEGRNFKRLLAIVDQHAADERCHVEDLLAELCSEPCIDGNIPREPGPQSGVPTMPLEKPLVFAMSEREVELLRTFSQHFADWGILFDIPPIAPSTDLRREERVRVRSLPPGIIERCKTDPKLLIDLLRSEAWRCHERVLAPNSSDASSSENQVPAKNIGTSNSHAWLQRIHRCPQGILDMLNSRSCRSAIMFNDELSDTQCCLLLSRLANCAFPFQCAHGRPSVIPLVDLGMLHDQRLSDEGFHNSQERFGVRFKRWKHEMMETIV